MGHAFTVEDTTENAPVDDLAEEKFCLEYGLARCALAYPLRDEALQWAQEKVGVYWDRDSLSGGLGDAARHAYWMCRTAEDFGVDFAKGLGDAHEEDSGYIYEYKEGELNNPCENKLMDLHNNGIGRDLAGQPGTCEEKVLNSLDALRTRY